MWRTFVRMHACGYMYVCMHARMHACMCAYMYAVVKYVRLRVCVRAFVYDYRCLRVCACLHVRMCVRAHACVCVFVCMCVRVCAHTHVCVCVWRKRASYFGFSASFAGIRAESGRRISALSMTSDDTIGPTSLIPSSCNMRTQECIQVCIHINTIECMLGCMHTCIHARMHAFMYSFIFLAKEADSTHTHERGGVGSDTDATQKRDRGKADIWLETRDRDIARGRDRDRRSGKDKDIPRRS